VRITTSEVIGGEVMPAILTRLRRTYPGLVLELALTNRSEDLLRRDADIAVRMVQPSQSAVVARRIGSIGLGLYGHRDYLTRHGFPHSLADLSAHAIIGFDRDDSSARAVGFDMDSLRRAMAFRCDSDLAKLAALRAGFGLGVCQKPLAARNQDLIPVLSDQLNFNLDMWLAMHEDQRRSRRIKLVFDFLVTELQRYVEFRE
jgi:DNA-binding transcriptional LysR family regulator